VRCQILCSDAYHAPLALGPRHPWQFVPATLTNITAGTIQLGAITFGGVHVSLSSWSATVSAVTATTYYWVALDMLMATATWGSGAGVPSSNEKIQYRHVLTLTCAGGYITAIDQPWPADIDVLINQ
jgi:hypothetical protein